MEVKILGIGCARCNSLEKLVRDVVAEQGIDATVTKVTQLGDILSYPIMGLPSLVIDEEVKANGRIPTKQEIVNWITEAQRQATPHLTHV